jgi:hypothetical protein
MAYLKALSLTGGSDRKHTLAAGVRSGPVVNASWRRYRSVNLLDSFGPVSPMPGSYDTTRSCGLLALKCRCNCSDDSTRQVVSSGKEEEGWGRGSFAGAKCVRYKPVPEPV